MRGDLTYRSNWSCDNNFKSFFHTTNIVVDDSSDRKEVTTRLSAPKKVLNVFILTEATVLNAKWRTGTSYIWIGDNSTPFSVGPSVTKCSAPIYDSGFYKLLTPTEGVDIVFRREQKTYGASDNAFLLYELRAYQVPNLLLELQGTATISATPLPSSSQWGATNLLNNLSSRTSSSGLSPIIDGSGQTASYNSCYKTDSGFVQANNDKMVLVLDLKRSFFQHAVLFVQDFDASWYPYEGKILLENVRVYVGEFPDYTKNVECPGGPYMVNDQNNADSYEYVSYPSYWSGKVWKFGREVWCNLQGQYMILVSDMSHKSTQSYFISLCQLAVFGTVYVRSVPVPASIELCSSRFKILPVEKIAPDSNFAIGNTLNIKLRQKVGKELSWVTITESTLVSNVILTPGSTVAPGDYTLILESFDFDGGVFSALKTDTITVKVLPYECCGALDNNFNTLAPIVLVKEYLPTVFFPQLLFSGPHTFTGFACGGTYTQSIAINAPVVGVVLTDQPTGTDLRPRVAVLDTAPASASFTLTFSGRYVHTPSQTDISASFTQTYQLKSVVSSDYLDQPTITHTLKAADLTFNVPPAAAGSPPPTHSLAASFFNVAYPIKAGITDSLGNTPPAIVPVPYTGFSASDFSKSMPSLGLATLLSPQGVLNVQGAGSYGNLSEGIVTFTCDAWTLSLEGTTVPKVLTFINSVAAALTTSLNVFCNYQRQTAPTFATPLPSVVLTASVPSSWTLPPIVGGSFPLKLIRFEPDRSLAGSLVFDAAARMVQFDGDTRIVDLFATTQKVLFTLVDEQGNQGAYAQKISVCPVTSSDIDALASALSADPLSLALTAGKAASTQVLYTSKYEKMLVQLNFSFEKQVLCGAPSIELVTGHSFLAHQPAGKSLILTADRTTEPASFDDSYLLVKLNRYSFKMPVRVEFSSCSVTRLSFGQSTLGLVYKVGSGSQLLSLPTLVQKPDCGLRFDKLFIKTILSEKTSPQIVQTAVKLDLSKHAVVVTTYDDFFVGKNATVVFAVEAPGVDSVQDLQVTLAFVGAAASTSQKPKAETETTVTLNFDPTLSATLGIPDFTVPQVTPEQAGIIETPPSQLSIEQLFAPVPLAARLTAGIDQVIDQRLAQREAYKKQIAEEFAAGKPRPPEIRLDSFSALGVVKFKFTQRIDFPKNITETLRAELGQARHLAKDFSSNIEVFAVAGQTTADQIIEPIMQRWELVSLGSDTAELKIRFFKPLNVSNGEAPDRLVVQWMLSKFKDENGRSLPLSYLSEVKIPRQFASELEAQIVEQGGEAAQSALLASLTLNFLSASAAGEIWSIVNNVQVVLMIRFFDVKTPGNVNAFNDFFADVTNLQGISIASEEAINQLFYLPDQDPKSLNLQTAGFNSPFFVKNAKEMLVVKVFFVCLPLLSVLLWLPAKCSLRVGRWRQKLHEVLFWNTYIRLMMESYAELTLLAIYNLTEMEWPANDTTSVTHNNWLTIAFLGYLFVFPLLLFYILFKHFDLHATEDKQFNQRFGSFLEGTQRARDMKYAVMLVPAAFFVKRLCLSVTLVFWSDFFWGQIAVQYLVTTAMIIFLQHAKPYMTRFANSVETFNEFTTWLILYFLMMFSPLVPDPEARSKIGLGYIATLALYATCHVQMLFGATCENLKLRLRLKRCLFHGKCCMWCFTSRFGCFKVKFRSALSPVRVGVLENSSQPQADAAPGSQVLPPSVAPPGLAVISEASERLEQSNREAPVASAKKKRTMKKKKKNRRKKRRLPKGSSRIVQANQLHKDAANSSREPFSFREQDHSNLDLVEPSESSKEDDSGCELDESPPKGMMIREDFVSGEPFLEDQLEQVFRQYDARDPLPVRAFSPPRRDQSLEISDDSDDSASFPRVPRHTLSSQVHAKTQPVKKQQYGDKRTASRKMTLEEAFDKFGNI